jgi:hypothetical protein
MLRVCYLRDCDLLELSIDRLIQAQSLRFRQCIVDQLG